jgi:pyruvate dehydrogenase E2 component (dihydrolipoamide acetyltransferase)
MALQEVRVPDIGDFSDVEVIEILVAPGDTVAAEDSLITLESDKASMEIPAPAAGTIRDLKIQLGDKLSEGDIIALLEASEAIDVAANENGAGDAAPPVRARHTPTPLGSYDVQIPDIGDFDGVEVIELLVQPGDKVLVDDSLITLESDKASMEIPSPRAGTVKALHVKIGDKVAEGQLIVTLEVAVGEVDTQPQPAPAESARPAPAPAAPAPVATDTEPLETIRRASPTSHIEDAGFHRAHASPAVRRFARELGAELSRIQGTGRKNRILKEDVKAFVKQSLTASAGGAGQAAAVGGAGIPPMPEVDFSKWGEVEVRELKRIQKLSGAHLHRAWLNVPHVTHHDEADITELEAFRQSLKKEAERKGVRITLLAFIMKALTRTLQEYPHFNASLSADGASLIVKKYIHLGIAVDTKNGLVVPVFRDVDRKSVFELAEEMGEVSARARDGKLKPDEMQGGCMSISSLGGIGGTAFAPIVNAPEIAILGVARSRMTPVWNGKEFVPRLMQPLDLSYDHRVIDGAEAARFVAYLAALLGDMRRTLL